MNQCRHCKAPLELELVDLATAPPSNAYVSSIRLSAPETYYPLKVLVCETCWLVQTEDYNEANHLFDEDYAYFSSVSATWQAHCETYVDEMVSKLGLTAESCVVEVAANDGCLLNFVKSKGIKCYGIEPTASTAAVARNKSIEIVEEFFGAELATQLASANRQADLIAANNVFAHVPDINDFASGFAKLLKPTGVATFEFPHLEEMIRYCLFDTIYHEHYSYLSLIAVKRILAEVGLEVFDVQRIETHGGSLRVFVQRGDTGTRPISPAVADVIEQEHAAGLSTVKGFSDFQLRTENVKNDLLRFLLRAKSEGKRVACYGAAAKGNTLLNYAGVRSDMVEFVVDRAPSKQGKFLPGSRIPIVAEDRLENSSIDYVLILPWNIKSEIAEQLKYIREWGGQFVAAVPRLEVF